MLYHKFSCLGIIQRFHTIGLDLKILIVFSQKRFILCLLFYYFTVYMPAESNTQRKKRLRQESIKTKISQATPKSNWYLSRIVGAGIVVLAGFFFFSQNSIASDPFEVRQDDYTKWAVSGNVTLIEYLDFECGVCKANYPLIKQLAEEFSGDVQIVVRYFPLPGHRNSFTAAYAAEAAWRQGKFREMHDLLFEKQQERGEKQQANQEMFIGYAQEIGLNIQQFTTDVVSAELKERVERDKEEWTKLWVKWTPSFFLNGQKIQNPRSIQEFRTLLQAEVLKNPKEPRGEKVHEHADFKVFIDNQPVDFSDDRFQSTTGVELSSEQHLHDNNGDNIHKHLTKKTMVDFFDSLWVTITEECIELDTGKKYCAQWEKTLKFFVNDSPMSNFMDYEFSDLDRILISYGAETWDQIQNQLDAVTDMACMYSAKCPERGTPPTENCVVWLWGDC